MDFLKAELSSKRKAMEQDTSRHSKYMRKGDIEKIKAEEERKKRETEQKAKLEAEEKAKAKAVEVRFCSTYEVGLAKPCRSL